ncbi:uncharacterized protein LOC101855768 [Aplysia californica]|uniref:Uncharacterized protein LOC101855768 n=1 Tax=Aplysia californica TaxID=6500 RepID=A0ABM0KAK8_APLCA|nr:uncharacterized protein LOC101855768 [Aplysia californica]
MTSSASLLNISLIILSVVTCLASTQMTVSTVVSDAELGQWFTVQCQVSGSLGLVVIIQISKDIGSNKTTLVNHIINGNITTDKPPTRISYNSDTYTVNISNANCQDEIVGAERVKYVCDLTYVTTATATATSSKEVTIKARPQEPSILSTSPASLLSDKFVVEGTEVKVTCSANVGRETKGSIVWRIYRNNTPEFVSDARVKSVERTGSPSCTRVMDSTLTVASVSRSDQDLAIACFVVNSDFNAVAPELCSDPAAALCQLTETIRVHYPVKEAFITGDNSATEEGSVTLTCYGSAVPDATYVWFKSGDENRTLSESNILTLTNLSIAEDAGEYNCTASNNVSGTIYSASQSFKLTIVPTTPAPTTTPEATDGPTEPVVSGDTSGDDQTIIIAVCVSVVILIILAIIIGIICWKRRKPRKEIEEPSEKPYNNRPNLSFQNPQPDLVADEKKFNNPSLNNSFDQKNEDGLMYADLTYDNRPRSRKPMALGDAMSDYSDVQMPEV